MFPALCRLALDAVLSTHYYFMDASERENVICPLVKRLFRNMPAKKLHPSRFRGPRNTASRSGVCGLQLCLSNERVEALGPEVGRKVNIMSFCS